MRMILLAVILAVSASACKSHPLVAPADMFVNETVGPEYLEYVRTDSNLSADERASREANVEAFKALVKECKEE